MPYCCTQKKKVKKLLHECLNQVIAWCKNKQKQKKKIPKPNPQWLATIKNRKLAEKTDFFFLICCMITDVL